MRPRSQLAAAPARRGRGASGPTGARAARRRLTSRAPAPRSSAAPAAAPAGPGTARAEVAAAPQGASGKLWRRPRGAVSAGAPGSPLYRVSAPPPAPRAAPPRRRRAAPPGASGRGQGSDPAPLSRPGRSGASRYGRAGSAGRLRCSAAALGAAPRSGPARAQVPPALRTFSPGPASPPRAPSRPARLGASRPERSGVRTPGWQDFGKTNFPVRKRRGPRGSSPPLPPSLPRVPPPLRSPLSPPPNPRAPPTPERPPRLPPPPGLPRPRARPPGPLLSSGGGLLNAGKGGDLWAPMSPPQSLFPTGAVARAPAEWAASASESSNSTEVPRAAHRVPGISGMTWGPVAPTGAKRQHRWPPGASRGVRWGKPAASGRSRVFRGPRAPGRAGGRGPPRGGIPACSIGPWPGAVSRARRAAFHSRIFPLASQPAFSRPPLIVSRLRFPRRLTPVGASPEPAGLAASGPSGTNSSVGHFKRAAPIFSVACGRGRNS
ncbi:basic proline-rich protein-like [Aotus nancymaae]|uniref:basic proline-rich protein-like n=1 Tax=Aotus nancymaae TaxID=37293 RepID=UPI0030FE8310